MRSAMTALIGLLLALPMTAKDPATQFKTVEATHFTRAEGVELSPEFTDYLYAELRNELKKAKLAVEVIGEGEAVDDADAANSIVIKGTITEYKKGNAVKAGLIGFGAGMRSLKLDASVTRRSGSQDVTAIHVHVKVQPRWDEKVLAKFAAEHIVKELKRSLKEQAKGA